MKTISKAWGSEEWIVHNELYTAKWLNISPGWRCSTHFHKVKDETFVVMNGACLLEINGKEHIGRVGDSFHIPPKTPHYFGLPRGWEPCTLLEVSTHHDDADVVRLSPSRKFTEDE